MIIALSTRGLCLLIFSLVLIFIYANSAFAQDATSTATTRKEKVQQRVETRKETAEQRITALKEKAASREAAMKAKLQTFRDKQKAQIAERVNTNLNKINQKITSEMLKYLTRMSEILAKLETRVNTGSPDIKDVISAKEAIASASASIALAQEAVQAQSEKDYTITVTSEAKIRQDAQNMRKQLHTDLQTVRKLVVDAKQAVGSAIRIAKSDPIPTGAELRKEGTISGQQ